MKLDNDKIEEEIFEEEIFEDEIEEESLVVGKTDDTSFQPPLVPTIQEDVKIEGDGRNFSELSNYEKIKFASAQNGVSILEPKKDCKHCYATGVVSTRTIKTLTSPESATKKEYAIEVMPNPCKCIFKKEDIHKMFTGRVHATSEEQRMMERQEQRKKVKGSFELLKQKQNRLKKKKEKKKKAKQKKKKR